MTLFFSGKAELAVGLKIKLLIIIIWMYSHFINLLFGKAELAVRLQVLIIAGEHAVRLVLKMAIILPTGQWYAPSAVINVPWYCMVLHGIAWYCMVLHCIAWYYMILHGIACHCIVLHGIAWYCMVLHGIALYCMVLHDIS